MRGWLVVVLAIAPAACHGAAKHYDASDGVEGDAGRRGEEVVDAAPQPKIARVALTHRDYTTEGDVVSTTYLSVPTAAGCSVIVIDDFTQDHFGNCTLLRRECASVSVALDQTVLEEDCSDSELLSAGC